jgi:hypothetical protein
MVHTMLDELSADHHLSDPTADPSRLLFHYTSAESLRAILSSGNVRLNTLDRMNDPRERKDWVARGLLLPDGDVDLEALVEQDTVGSEPNRLLRRGARIACFTQERSPSSDAAPGALFHRGWARARMWYQYANDHAGACLVFDWAELAESLDRARQLQDGEVFSISPVRYADKPLSLPLSGSFPNVASVRAALEDLTSDGRNIADLFFTKNTDWQSEDEVRIMVLQWNPDGTNPFGPMDLPYGTSLKAVVLGENFSDTAWLDHAVAVRNLPMSDVLRADWVDGAPTLKPLMTTWRRLA